MWRTRTCAVEASLRGGAGAHTARMRRQDEGEGGALSLLSGGALGGLRHREAGPGPQRRQALGRAEQVTSEEAGLGWAGLGGHLRGGGPWAGLSRPRQRRRAWGRAELVTSLEAGPGRLAL